MIVLNSCRTSQIACYEHDPMTQFDPDVNHFLTETCMDDHAGDHSYCEDGCDDDVDDDAED